MMIPCREAQAGVLPSALAAGRPGRYQIEGAIAALLATNVAERDHLIRQAARARVRRI